MKNILTEENQVRETDLTGPSLVPGSLQNKSLLWSQPAALNVPFITAATPSASVLVTFPAMSKDWW